MGRKKRNGDNKLQLYFIFQDIRKVERDNNECALLISYGILNSLYHHEQQIDKKAELNEQAKFETAKAIYGTLREAIEKCHEESTYFVTAGLQREITDGQIDEILANIGPSKRLLSDIVANTGLVEEKLRKAGLRVMAEVQDHGPYSRPYDWLNNNYSIIREVFVESRR